MVSSTFEDLKEHRSALIGAISGAGFHAVAMEHDSAKADVDLIESSLRMVRDAAAYALVIAHKYGQVPVERNPEGLSITELEFNEAVRLGRPILLFLMGEDHLVRKGDVEPDPVKKAKLEAFRERTKVGRVYATFESLEDFRTKATQAVAGLPKASVPVVKGDPIPAPPAFYAEPPYIGSHKFVGRAAELDRLDDWASASDTHPVLLFEAIGGSGKSMLTWEWTTKRSTLVRQDWAGRFWYSFYERGAVMADFCRRALAYMTGQPLAHFTKMRTPDLGGRLLHQLRSAPWLLVLDGLERVLVAYHRIDAAQLTEEAAEQPTDQISHRDPCVAIRPEDDDLLRMLAGAESSKVLITSRLIPRVLLNAASQAIPGVQRIALPGLRPVDAEALFRSCGVRGDSKAIQDYLKANCDCHPLVTGVLAGLVNHYLPDRGNFDTWANGLLNLAELDLKQKRNHILRAAIDALGAESRQVLATMAILSEALDYTTLAALSSLEPGRLAEGIKDLEHRALVQYDSQTKRYDLHPVVRSIAAGGLRPEERAGQGQRVVDYFSQRAHCPYDEAETIEDVRDGLRVVRTLLQMGKYEAAFNAFGRGLSDALVFNLEASAEVVSLLRPFFPAGWSTAPQMVESHAASYLSSYAAIGLRKCAMIAEAMSADGSALMLDVRGEDWANATADLGNIANSLYSQNRLSAGETCLSLALEIAKRTADRAVLFGMWLAAFEKRVATGRAEEAESAWRILEPMGREWPRYWYRPGQAETWYAELRFLRGDLSGEDLDRAERLAEAGKNRGTIRHVHELRGRWRLERGEWALAVESLGEAVRRAREVGADDRSVAAGLALAKFHCGELTHPQEEAERLESLGQPGVELAELWAAIGDVEGAKRHALAAYKWAWADGEPHVFRWDLDKARALLEKLGAEVPVLPPYDPAKAPKFPWEDEVRAAIEKLKAAGE
jgi:tetratricopeptide (TPR) repeat protein